MKDVSKPLAVFWLTGAVLLSFLSFQGGDSSIVAGWLHLIWTAPFGVVWWFDLYDIVLVWLPANVAQPVGVLVVDLVAFVFWFLLLPISWEQPAVGLPRMDALVDSVRRK